MAPDRLLHADIAKGKIWMMMKHILILLTSLYLLFLCSLLFFFEYRITRQLELFLDWRLYVRLLPLGAGAAALYMLVRSLEKRSD